MKKNIIVSGCILTISLITILYSCSDKSETNIDVNETEITSVSTSPFVGTWICDSTNSCNGADITLTVSQNKKTLHFERDMKMSSESASSNIVFSLACPSGNELDAPDIKGSYVLTDTTLYEIFDNGRQNKYYNANSESEKTSYEDDVSATTVEPVKPTPKPTQSVEKPKTQTVSVPYEGMSESMISSTSLGVPTTSEKCKDFYQLKPSHRHTEYRWYENDIQDLEHLKAVATVWYWDHKTKKEVSGYVSSITIYK